MNRSRQSQRRLFKRVYPLQISNADVALRKKQPLVACPSQKPANIDSCRIDVVMAGQKREARLRADVPAIQVFGAARRFKT
jgi:hypothetical protein